MFRFQPSVESLETRETPSGTAIASTTDLILDSYNSTSSSGPGVYKSVDLGKTWILATDTAPKADPLPVLMVIADRDYY